MSALICNAKKPRLITTSSVNGMTAGTIGMVEQHHAKAGGKPGATCASTSPKATPAWPSSSSPFRWWTLAELVRAQDWCPDIQQAVSSDAVRSHVLLFFLSSSFDETFLLCVWLRPLLGILTFISIKSWSSAEVLHADTKGVRHHHSSISRSLCARYFHGN